MLSSNEPVRIFSIAERSLSFFARAFSASFVSSEYSSYELCKIAGLEFADLIDGIVIGSHSKQYIPTFCEFLSNNGLDSVEENDDEEDKKKKIIIRRSKFPLR